MKEAPITRSPHAFVPKDEYTQEEKDEIYRTRVDQETKPYTVIDVLTKVYHRDFADDLQQYIGEHPEEFSTTSAEWGVARVWVNTLKIIRPESIFFQKRIDFKVDILADAAIKLEEARMINASMRNRYTIKRQLRLRYSFDFRPCHLDCHFVGVILREEDSLRAKDPVRLATDKYLLPIFLEGDYERIAGELLLCDHLSNYEQDLPLDPMEWLKAQKAKVYMGIFPEKSTVGEYFFHFGTADVVHTDTGEILHDAEIGPGTILIDRDTFLANHANQTATEGTRNVTLVHEGVHHVFGQLYFHLQLTHGHQYCSYMCKRLDQNDPHGHWTPIQIMEMQANKMPGYLMIPEKNGKKHAEMLLKSYGGARTIQNMQRLITDMADYYETTKTMARTRLIDFGYREVQGLQQRANGELVPGYLSTLARDETYTIDEADGVREYMRNPEFRRVLRNGDYIYAEGSYCRNDPKYVERDPYDDPHLTPYARAHMAECCLVFKISYDNAIVKLINGVLSKGTGRGRRNLVFRNQDGSSAVTEEGRNLRREILQEQAIQYVVEKPFSTMLVDLMEKRKITIVPLAEATGLSRDTIKNMRNRADIQFPIQEIVAVAIALHLPQGVSEEFIRRAPSAFLSTDEMYCYQYALNHWYRMTVPAVNRKLVEMGIAPLTNLVEGYDENGVKMEEDQAM